MNQIARDHEAHHKIDSHEKVCAERYGNLWTAIKELKEDVRRNGIESNSRLTAMSNRMWALVIAGGGSGFLGLAVLVFYLLTKGKS